MSNELRWNPVLGAWIIVAAKRQKRPWRPKDYCPFCPGAEETGYGWEVLALPNKFPALRPDAKPSLKSEDIYKVRPGYGYCEVIVETPKHEGDLCDLTLENLKKVIDLYAERYEKLGSDPKIKYVFEFRNKGALIGVSLTHPHSQLYALPFIPPRIRRELVQAKKFYKRRKKCLFCHIIDLEKKAEVRLLYENEDFILFMPFFAMWPYETHIYSKRHLQNILQLTEKERYSLADVLKVCTKMYNSLFGFDLPYIMAIHQSPTDGKEYPYYHFHIEFYPLHRDAKKIKYAAGIEWGTWTFTYDGLPEERAQQLRQALHKALEELSREYKPLGSPK
ncbi:MAG: galactose-1-phosphate uridylyltransferase [Thermoprotei archaeon]|nr:MAG: galactose-1-phosphate uridylyltransferase [Thermoprotei archaeon]